MTTPVRAPWAESAAAVVAALGSSRERGLSDQEARRRLQQYGPNQLPEASQRSGWRILCDQFASLIVLLLAAAAAIAFAFGEAVEGCAILVVILLNAGIGFLTERRAVRSMEALRMLGHIETNVRRDGSVRAIPASRMVPGDIVVLDAGDVLSADLRLLTASRLQADESALTGESLPVEKGTAAVAADAPLAERPAMLHKGTAVTRGAGEGIVTATGLATQLGKISSLVATAQSAATPLEKRLDRLGRRLIVLTLMVAAIVTVTFLVSGRGLFLAVEIGIALAVATFPEGLPIVATIALARGMWRMARRNALIEQLSAVETLGSTTIILTDKTGTLTENRMTAVELRLASGSVRVTGTGLANTGDFVANEKRVVVAESPELVAALRIGVLCNNATLNQAADGTIDATGDPTEIALLVAGAKGGLERSRLIEKWPEVKELAFDPDHQRMATLHQHGDTVLAAVKGAPETVLEHCTSVRSGTGAEPLSVEQRAAWVQAANDMAASGQRVLTLAMAEVASPDEFAFEQLELAGLVGMFDPPRKHVRPAIAACQLAGIRVVMVTGDHGATGWTVAAEVGVIDPPPGTAIDFVDARKLPPFDQLSTDEIQRLLTAAVIARATPRQKLDLIALHQQHGAVVAMTGDGVNDAPALKQADIGVAMGQRGTQVAREAAKIVLRDDEFGSIVAAVEQGRAIFANIRKFVIYLLSCNVSEIVTVGLGALASGPLPLLPLQILFLNLVTDVFPALALGVCEGSPALMRHPPRDPSEPMLLRRHWWNISLFGSVLAMCVLAALALAVLWLEKPDAEATTIAFLTLAMAQLWHVFSMRDQGSHWLRNEVTRNPWVWAATALCVALLVLAVHWPLLAQVLSVADPGWSGWLLALGVSLVPLLVGQIGLLLRRPAAPTSATRSPTETGRPRRVE